MDHPGYWNPLPTAHALAAFEAPTRFPTFSGKWEERNWRNVPGPFYGADTDCMEMGRYEAPRHIAYDGEHEFVFRQPVNAAETECLVAAAQLELYSGYAWDGDEHWTPETVRDWWRDRGRVRQWAVAAAAEWAGYDEEPQYFAHYHEAAQGHRDFVAYIDDGLEAHLRGYLFWLEQRREPRPGEALPGL
ncbi:ferredoxin [Streptomyces sp. NPDC048337]|uniref:ferredoxin n=1 Tax=Streptomyces sp. NPDC048337 TaxID=3365535 RepID=UPI00371A8F6E